MMAHSLPKNGCSVSDIPYPPLPHPKAMQAELTSEGINRGEAEEPFPEPSPGAPCPSLLTTSRALGLVHRGVSYEGKLRQSTGLSSYRLRIASTSVDMRILYRRLRPIAGGTACRHVYMHRHTTGAYPTVADTMIGTPCSLYLIQ